MTLSIEGEIVTPDTQLTNTTYDELEVGMSASLVKRLTMQDIQLFAVMSGDYNPAHLDGDYAKSSRFHEIIAHGMWGGALILGTVLTRLAAWCSDLGWSGSANDAQETVLSTPGSRVLVFRVETDEAAEIWQSTRQCMDHQPFP